MQLKKSLIGAIVGGLIGIGVLVAASMLFRTQHTALALVIAVLVGVGVRVVAVTKGHASYLRGALAALVAGAAFIGGNLVVAKIAQLQQAANSAAPMLGGASAPEVDAPADGSAAATTPPSERASETRDAIPTPIRGVRAPLRSAYSTWDVIWLSVALLVAYELGRGSGTVPNSASPPPDAPATPAATA